MRPLSARARRHLAAGIVTPAVLAAGLLAGAHGASAQDPLPTGTDTTTTATTATTEPGTTSAPTTTTTPASTATTPVTPSTPTTPTTTSTRRTTTTAPAYTGPTGYFAAAQIGINGAGVLRFPQAVATAPDGTIYVADQGSHLIQVFNPDLTYRGSIGVPGTRPGELTAVGALAVADDGSILVADGGTSRIVRFAPDGRVISQFGGRGTTPGKFSLGGGRGNDAGAGGGLAVAGGFVYVADSGNNRIQRLRLDGSGAAVIVPPGTVKYPKGLAVRKSRLFISDDQNHRVLVTDTGGKTLKVIGTGFGKGPGQMQNPYGVALDAAGRVFVADDMNQRVLRFSTQGTGYKYKGRWGSYGTGPGNLAYPRAIATDDQGRVLVTNTGNDRVDVFSNTGALLGSLGTSGRASGQFNAPSGVASDGSGITAVTDSVNGRVEFFGPDGSFRTAWGSPNPGPTVLLRPVDVAFDAAGNAYVLDQRRARVFVFPRNTGTPARSFGTLGSGPGQLSDPSAIWVDPRGIVSVADTGNARIARFGVGGNYIGAITGVGSPRGVAVTADGSRTYVTNARNQLTAYTDGGQQIIRFGGTGTKLGKLRSPHDLTIDANGNLWVADAGNARVQQFGPDGQRLQTFGTRGTHEGQFITPTSVDLDCSGVLSVVDQDNNRVQRFGVNGGPAIGCGAPLAPLATPPAPKSPTLPQPDGPQVSLRALRTAGLLSSRNLPLRASCDTACTLSLTVTLTPRSAPAKGKRVAVQLVTVKRTLGAGENGVLRAKLTTKQAATLRRALKGRKALTAEVALSASADVGAATEQTQSLSVTG